MGINPRQWSNELLHRLLDVLLENVQRILTRGRRRDLESQSMIAFSIIVLCLILVIGMVGIGDDENGDSGHRWTRINGTDYMCAREGCGRVKREHCRDHRRACPVSWEVIEDGSGSACKGEL